MDAYKITYVVPRIRGKPLLPDGQGTSRGLNRPATDPAPTQKGGP